MLCDSLLYPLCSLGPLAAFSAAKRWSNSSAPLVQPSLRALTFRVLHFLARSLGRCALLCLSLFTSRRVDLLLGGGPLAFGTTQWAAPPVGGRGPAPLLPLLLPLPRMRGRGRQQQNTDCDHDDLMMSHVSMSPPFGRHSYPACCLVTRSRRRGHAATYGCQARDDLRCHRERTGASVGGLLKLGDGPPAWPADRRQPSRYCQRCATSMTSRDPSPGPGRVNTRNGNRARTPSPTSWWCSHRHRSTSGSP